MAATGEYQTRTRVICSLPLKNPAQEKAFKAIIQYIEEQRTLAIGITGYTYSERGTFHGFWWNEKLGDQGDWEYDKIIFLIIDYDIPPNHPTHTVSEKIAELKTTIDDAYFNYNSEQQEIWVIANTVSRYL